MTRLIVKIDIDDNDSRAIYNTMVDYLDNELCVADKYIIHIEQKEVKNESLRSISK